MTRTVPLFCQPGDLAGAIGLASGISSGISLAKAGDMALSRRRELPCRERFLESLGASAAKTYALHQVHSKTVVAIDHQDPEALVTVEADGMVTARPDVLLTVTVADCLPIFLLDEATGAIGLVHSGWKGTGIVVEAIRLMAEAFGTRSRDLAAAIGPGIGPCCYTVPQERYERYRAEFGETAVARGASRDFRLDLKAANVRLLEAAGVQRIVVIADCTCCSAALGSFRREGQGFRRMLAFMGGFLTREAS